MKLPTAIPELPAWAWAALGFGAVWLLLRPKDADKRTTGEKVGEGIVDAVVTIAAVPVNMVKGVGDRLTDIIYPIDQCAASMRADDLWGASWHCRPATFLSWIANGRPRNVSILEDGSIYAQAASPGVQPTRPSAHGAFTGPAPRNTSPVTTPSILNGGSLQTGADCILLGVDCDVTGGTGFDFGEWIEEHNRDYTPVAGLRG